MSNFKDNFKRCSKGHFYKKELASCPYCNRSSSEKDKTDNNSANKTDKYKNQNNKSAPKTEIFVPEKKAEKTSGVTSNNANDRTIIVTGDKETNRGQHESQRRRLVGWLVSYEMDVLGIDYKVYEGKNTIGRSNKNSISISERTVSDPHATLLFRNDKYYLKDEFSSNGTYLNGEEIEQTRIKNNDIITFGKGKAIFIFKSSF